MALSMADQPIIFAMANPDPEILPEDVLAVREDAMIATGRSDYPNQVNNVLGFPYIFRGALDVRASTINTRPMKIAATKAIAALAREDVPDEVGEAYGRRPSIWQGLSYSSALRPSFDRRRAKSSRASGHGFWCCPSSPRGYDEL